MKKHYYLIVILSFLLQNLPAQTLWTGPKITFTKANHADWTLEANQDRITDDIWITRKNGGYLINAKVENSQSYSSPLGTQWAIGKISDGISNLTFNTFGSLAATDGVGTVISSNPDFVLHLTDSDIYIDVKFLSWTSGDGTGNNNGSGNGAGGGFSYERSTPAPLGIDKINLKHVTIFPNPVRDLINIKELKTNEPYKIISLLGEVIQEDKVDRGRQIRVDKLSKGIYFLKLKNKDAVKFIKQ